MPLTYHPNIGTIVICDYQGFISPEMIKRRPAIVISPRFRKRNNLCTVVPLGTTPPDPPMPYHYKLVVDPPLPKPYDSPVMWVKADMFATVSFSRLFIPQKGKLNNGKRDYDVRIIEEFDLKKIQECVLHAIGLPHLTGHI